MKNRPRVYVVERRNRGLCLRWHDGDKWRERKSHARTRRSAEREARDFEIEIEKKASAKAPQSWESFCDRYENEVVDDTSRGNRCKWSRVRRLFTSFLIDQGHEGIEMRDITIDMLSSFRSTLKKDMATATVKSYFATLRAGFSYASELNLMEPLPSLRRRGRKDEMPVTMKGRPVVQAEFQRMLDVTDDVVGSSRGPEFRRVLKMIWLGGLRVEDPLWFHASRMDCHRIVELDRSTPAVLFSSKQKNGKFQRVPMLDDWAEFCRTLPDKKEWLFNPLNARGWRITTGNELGRWISRIGRQAKVVIVAARDDQQPRYATAQNLRQGFGHRLAPERLPADLQMRMRHASIETTMKFYVGLDLDAVFRRATERKAESL